MVVCVFRRFLHVCVTAGDKRTRRSCLADAGRVMEAFLTHIYTRCTHTGMFRLNFDIIGIRPSTQGNFFPKTVVVVVELLFPT